MLFGEIDRLVVPVFTIFSLGNISPLLKELA